MGLGLVFTTLFNESLNRVVYFDVFAFNGRNLLPSIVGQVQKLSNEAQPHQWLKLFQDPPAAFTNSVTLSILLDDLVKLHDLDSTRIVP